MDYTNNYSLIADILVTIRRSPANTALVIEDEEYTYDVLGRMAASVYSKISPLSDSVIGVVAGNDIQTYAALLGVLFSGKAYVVLHPSFPEERNLKTVSLAGVRTTLCSSLSGNDYLANCGVRLITPEAESGHTIDDIAYSAPEDANAYIIFTSGSTGEPKGVPITRGNLNAFGMAYRNIGWALSETDRMLQMFELTFDVSVVSTLYPLSIGASVYTVGYKDVKYLKVFELIERYELTFAAVAPSVLQLISPYFEEIELPSLRYLVVTAEASQTTLLQSFRRCIPNAEIYNLYGPTEATIYCTYYRIPQSDAIKQHNGMVAIGKPFAGLRVLIVGEDGHSIPAGSGDMGEMWVAGPQVMYGYFNDPVRSAESLVMAADGETYYKTGDLCLMDAEGDIIYCGRKDYQVKIQGFRIELSEIEFAAKQFFDNDCNVVVIPIGSGGICNELQMVVEITDCDKDALMKHLAAKLPYYMLPNKIHCIAQFPTSASNKTDRKQIAKLIS